MQADSGHIDNTTINVLLLYIKISNSPNKKMLNILGYILTFIHSFYLHSGDPNTGVKTL
jgi:hypothetical protein